MKRSASIYIGEDRIVLEPQDYSPEGSYHPGEPIITLPHSASVAEILAKLEVTLASCKQPTLPIDVKAIVRPLLAATGDKTWHAVCRAFANVDVRETDTELVFSPWIPHHGGFSGSGKDWHCDKSRQSDVVAGFRTAAAVAIEAQNLHNPPPLP